MMAEMSVGDLYSGFLIDSSMQDFVSQRLASLGWFVVRFLVSEDVPLLATDPSLHSARKGHCLEV